MRSKQRFANFGYVLLMFLLAGANRSFSGLTNDLRYDFHGIKISDVGLDTNSSALLISQNASIWNVRGRLMKVKTKPDLCVIYSIIENSSVIDSVAACFKFGINELATNEMIAGGRHYPNITTFSFISRYDIYYRKYDSVQVIDCELALKTKENEPSFKIYMKKGATDEMITYSKVIEPYKIWIRILDCRKGKRNCSALSDIKY